jgi:hypothetical protein
MPPQGWGGATIRETVFTCAYIGNISKKSSQDPMAPKSSNLHNKFSDIVQAQVC